MLEWMRWSNIWPELTTRRCNLFIFSHSCCLLLLLLSCVCFFKKLALIFLSLFYFISLFLLVSRHEILVQYTRDLFSCIWSGFLFSSRLFLLAVIIWNVHKVRGWGECAHCTHTARWAHNSTNKKLAQNSHKKRRTLAYNSQNTQLAKRSVYCSHIKCVCTMPVTLM